MRSNRRKLLLHVSGAAAIVFWVVMIGLLIRKVHFVSQGTGAMEGASRSIDSAEREWKEIFLNDRKVGYAVNLIKPFGEGYFIQEEIFLNLNLAGLGGSVYTSTQAQTDGEFSTRSFHFLMTSGVVRFAISGKVEGDYLVLTTGSGETARAQRIKLNQAPLLGAGMNYFLRTKKWRVGERFTFPLLDPATMTQREALVKVVGKEPLTIQSITYDSYRLEAEVWGKTMTLWLDENGAILKEQGFMGLTVVKSSAARAPEGMEGEEGIDLYEISAVKPDRSLRDPARLTHLQVKMEGMEEKHFSPLGLQGGRQHMEKRILTIDKERFPKPSYSLPHVYPEEIERFLEAEFNIESNDPEIVKKAREISGEETNPLMVARKMLQWVYQHIEKRPVLSVPSAAETLRTRVGDCNEHATLLTALLRASGIPARISAGLVYTRDKFYYHAWTEAYVGTWITMDATLNQLPADATHIKFLEGNLEKQVEMTRVLGELKVNILDFRYD